MTNKNNILWLSVLSVITGMFVHAPAFAADVNATYLGTINTAAFSPPSPDPSGLAFLNSGRLLICDGEVDEMTIYQNANLYEMSRTGSLLATSNTLAYSAEPVGCANNAANGHRFISDDDQKRVYQFLPGSNSPIASFSTTSVCGSSDPEGLAYGSGALWIIDGVNAEVYRVVASADGIFDGVGESCTHFDTASHGLTDPEGAESDPDNPNALYVVGKPSNTVFQFTTAGTLTRTIGIAAANARKPAGLAAVPKSVVGGANPQTHLYIVDRGVDNDSDPNENDGKVYQFALPGSTSGGSNVAPTVAAGPDQDITFPASAILDGNVSDDGLPTGAAVTTTWSKADGPAGTVTFGNPAAVDTTASFPSPGNYTLRLTASDTQLTASDDITINVLPPPAFSTIYVSTLDAGTAGGVAFEDEDIIAYNTNTGTWSLFFDGSDVGLNASSAYDIDAFYIRPTDGSIFLSFTGDNLTMGNLTGVNDEDIVRFIPTSLGSTTAGTFEMYFDGSDVDLTVSAEDIDAFTFRSDGALIISTTGSFSVTGASGGDEDLLAFTANTLGANTTGTWALYFDGSDVGLNDSGSEDINAADMDSAGHIYLSTLGAFSVTGVSGDGNDIFRCIPGSTGSTTSCTSFTLMWNGNGLPAGAVVDGMQLANTPIQINNAPTVNITLPQNNAVFAQGASISFAGSASDTEDGNITSSLSWTSNLESSPLCTPGGGVSCGNFTKVLSTGLHTITASVTDSGGVQGSSSVSLTVNGPVNTPPNVTISDPPDASTYNFGASIPFNASANDAENGNLTASLRWSSDIDGDLCTPSGTPCNNFSRSLSVGTHTVTASVTDNGGLTGSANRTVTVNPPAGLSSLAVSVTSSSDDAEQAGVGGSTNTGSSDLELIEDGSTQQIVGIRFNGIAVPKGATIIAAYVQFKVDEATTAATNLTIQGQAIDTAPTFASAVNNITARGRTTASVAWNNVPGWSTVGAAGAEQKTPNIGPVIQEIVNRDGWVSGNSLALIITGNGKRTAEAFDGDQAGAPRLLIDYSLASPTVTISSPANGAHFTEGATVNFVGTATDPQQGDLTAMIDWSTSNPGHIGTGGTVSTSTLLAGPHTITATVTDSDGNSDSKTIDIIIDPAPTMPTVSITSPANGTHFFEGAAVGFAGNASDPQDGDLTAAISWTSSINGLIGSGGSVSTLALSVGTHTITATVTDIDGNSDSKSIDIIIDQIPTLPTVSITSPANNARFIQGTNVSFSGSASDYQDGDLTAALSWNSSIDGPIGSGGGFSSSTLSTGTHTITASVTDLDNNPGSAVITVNIDPQTPSVLDRRVSGSNDDAEQFVSGGPMDLSSSDLELTEEATTQTVGMRFNAIPIPRGATIVSAYIQFQVDEATTTATSLQISGEATDHAAAFNVTDILSRPLTSASVAWNNVPGWPSVGAAGADQRTPDIAAVIQEIVDRGGWVAGNSLVVIINGIGKRVAESYDGVPAAAPLLHVDYY